jgi:hypothetical protein
MSIRRTAITLLAVAAALMAPGVALAAHRTDVLHACALGKLTLRLKTSHAEHASVPSSLVGNARTIVARELAELRATADGVCPAGARASVRAQAGRLRALYNHGSRSRARSSLRHLLAAVRARVRARAHKTSPGPRAHAAGTGCESETSSHVRPFSESGAADDLALARAAQLSGDEAGAREALKDAEQAFTAWASAGAGGAQSAGDWLAVAAAAQMLGLEGIANTAIARAGTIARDTLDQCEKLDRCTVTPAQARALARALTFAMMLGIDQPSDTSMVTALLEAAQELQSGKTPNGCEEWTLSAQMSGSDGWDLRWGPGTFRVDRKAGVVQDAPSVGAGWPGELAAWSGPCLENGVDVGTGNMPAAPFHFNISGTATRTGLSLRMTASDANVTIAVEGPAGCHLVAELGQWFVNELLKAPFPVELSVAEGQRTSSFQYSTEGGTFTATATRVS